MELPGNERRCKRSDGAKWRCSEMASSGKSYCEKHLLQQQMKNRREKTQMQRIGENDSGKFSRGRKGNSGASENKTRRKRAISEDCTEERDFELKEEYSVSSKRVEVKTKRCVDGKNVARSGKTASELDEGVMDFAEGQTDYDDEKCRTSKRMKNSVVTKKMSMKKVKFIMGGPLNKAIFTNSRAKFLFLKNLEY